MKTRYTTIVKSEFHNGAPMALPLAATPYGIWPDFKHGMDPRWTRQNALRNHFHTHAWAAHFGPGYPAAASRFGRKVVAL